MLTVAQLDADLMTLRRNAYEKSTEPSFHRDKVDDCFSLPLLSEIVLIIPIITFCRSQGGGFLVVRQENYALARNT